MKIGFFRKCSFCNGKIDFEIFDFLDKSEDSELFFKIQFWKFQVQCQVQLFEKHDCQRILNTVNFSNSFASVFSLYGKKFRRGEIFSITIGQILSYDKICPIGRKNVFNYNRTNFRFYHMIKQWKNFFFQFHEGRKSQYKWKNSVKTSFFWQWGKALV